MFVSEIMTRNVVVVHPETAVHDAIRLMLDRHISGVPVLDQSGKLVGVFTEGDLLRRVELGTERHPTGWKRIFSSQGRQAQDYVASHARQVRDVMTAAVVSTTPKASLEEAVQLMEKHGIKRLPVLREGRLVGIISRANLLKVLLDSLVTDVSASDVEISRQIKDELQKQPWTPVETIGVMVNQGVVELTGVITDERFREALRVIAQNVPGVRAVKDHMAFVDQMSGMFLDAPEEEKSQTAV